MSNARILIADDEEGIRESLNLILGQKYQLDFVKDGVETLEALKSKNYGLALLDIKMPKLDGIEVLKEMNKEQMKVPVLILTAYQSVQLAQQAVNLGAKDYLPKPFERIC